MNNILKLTLFIIFITAIFISCDEVAEPDKVTCEDIQIGELIISDVFSFTSSETDEDKNNITDTTCFEKETELLGDGSFVTTLTFNDSCAITNSVTRGGQIIINWELGWRGDSSKIVDITLVNFVRNNSTLNGNLKIQLLNFLNKKYQISENDINITLNSDQVVTWSGVSTVEWVSGFLTLKNKYDDEKIINYSRDGVNRNGEKFSTEGTNIQVSNTCYDGVSRITSGKIIITNISNKNQKTKVEFDGCSDDNFTVTIIEE